MIVDDKIDTKLKKSYVSFNCTRRSEFEVFGPNGRVKCPTVWQPEDQTAKIIYTTEKSGLTEEVVPKANHFEREIQHFNEVILKRAAPKLDEQDAVWNAKTLEGIQKSIETNAWVNL